MKNPKRIGLSKRVRFAVFARDGFQCKYCGKQSTEVKLEVDHIKPVCQGGTNDEVNLITACEPCNRGKAGKTIEQSAPTEQDALRLAQERMEQLAALHAAEEAIRARNALESALVEFWCSQTGRDAVDRGTITTVLNYVKEFGMEMVIEWVASAVRATGGYNDRTMGKYVSGIRRSILKEREF